MDKPTRLELDGLSDLDRDELEELFSSSGAAPGDYTFSKPAPAIADRARDFGLSTVIVIIAPITIAAIGVWLAKKRDQETFTAKVKTFDANGQKHYESQIKWSSSHSAPLHQRSSKNYPRRRRSTRGTYRKR